MLVWCTKLCTLAEPWLSQWGAKSWPSDGVRYSWSDGTPDKTSGAGARSGVYSYLGTFRLQIPANSTATGPRKLKLYTGLFNYAKSPIGSPENWINSATLEAALVGQPTVSKTVTHMDGNNNDSVVRLASCLRRSLN